MSYSRLLQTMEHTDHNLVILGRGGSGKTHLINRFLEKTNLNVLRTAPTGLAAMAITGASTNHAAFGLLPTVAFQGRMPRLSPNHESAIQNANVWLVDEVSMVRGDQFHAIDAILRHFRGNSRPLGGIRLIAVGDFWQLSPVASEIEAGCLVGMGISDPTFAHGVYGTQVFEEVLAKAAIVELQGVFRQSQDEKDFVDLLDRCRRGRLSDADLGCLATRIRKTNIDGTTILTTTRRARDLFNQACLQMLPWQEWKVLPNIQWAQGEVEDQTLLDDCPGSKPVTLKLGMRIMFTKNDPAGRWANGTQGVLINVDPPNVTEPNRLAVQLDNSGECVIVHRQEFCLYRPHFDTSTNRGSVRTVAKVSQFPVEPAYSTTIHRSQGRTLRAAIVHLGAGAFASGQTYVALSRVPRLSALHLAGPILKSDILVSESARSFYGRFGPSISPVFPD